MQWYVCCLLALPCPCSCAVNPDKLEVDRAHCCVGQFEIRRTLDVHFTTVCNIVKPVLHKQDAYCFQRISVDRKLPGLAGYLRDYAAILPVMSHAYNFQANAYGFTDASRAADNQASEADLAVDPTLQVRLFWLCWVAFLCWKKLAQRELSDVKSMLHPIMLGCRRPVAYTPHAVCFL